MKRIFSLCLVVLLLVLSLASCQMGDSNGSQPEKNIYSTLNEMVAKNYSTVMLSIASTENGATMTDNYTIMQLGDDTLVTYSCTRRSVFEGDVIPDSYYTTYTGSLVIRDGKIVSQEGQSVDVSFEALSLKGLCFSGDVFSNVQNEAGKFTADIVDVDGFFGQSSFEISDASVSLTYGTGLQTLVITYTAQNGATVVIDYQLV